MTDRFQTFADFAALQSNPLLSAYLSVAGQGNHYKPLAELIDQLNR
jgi:hypothetical protein